ncbi:chaperone protein PsaB [Yersinia intermedia]|uniref:fimbria/pilus periplasmic chaperone n=1 Tax=Yersinia intermedia TaxID=631 RepID=UPI0005E9FF53|nr:fimbria/pilus periplasmic chaperone [Yersinia intermedia]CND04540.1 chaperone protein PsaB [Yersinia intermedia]CNH38252.1 chaperone protein PsaB [Yersinia intermedia]
MIRLTISLFLLSSFLLGKVYATDIKTSQKSYSVKLGSTRVIYNSGSKGASIIVTNPESYPVLIKAETNAENKTGEGSFIVTPPLFRLEAGMTSSLRIILKNDGMPKNRESLEWLCVRGIPPTVNEEQSSDSNTAEILLQVSMNTCNKILFRPSGLEGDPLSYAEKIKWSIEGNILKGINDSPFYMNISQLKVGGVDVFNPQYIAPFSEQKFELNKSATGTIEWRVITDNGGEGSIYQVKT